MTLNDIIPSESKLYVDVSCFFLDKAWNCINIDLLNKHFLIDYHLCIIDIDSNNENQEDSIMQLCHWLHDLNKVLSPHFSTYVGGQDLSIESAKLLKEELSHRERVSLLSRYRSLKTKLYRVKLPSIIDSYSQIIQ